MGVASEAATAVADNAVTAKKPRIKILMKKPVNGACEVPQTPEVICWRKPSTPLTADTEEKKRGTKRGTEQVSDSHQRKRLKMDRSTTIICQQILKKLFDHRKSGPFRVPVNPDAYGIPDYFDFIKKPMDLGTVKHRLKDSKYVEPEQFRADVKLTFSNAMLYNPPGNMYHEDAKELDRLFDRLWKPLEVRFVGEDRDAQQKDSESCNKNTIYDKCLESISAHRDQFPGKVLPRKKKGSEDLASIERQHSDLKATSTSLESVSDRRDQLPGKVLPQLKKSSEDLKMRSVKKQHSDLKAMSVSLESVSDCRDQFSAKVLPQKEKSFKDLNTRPIKAMKKIESKPQPKSRDSLSSKTGSNFSGAASQSVCSMPAEVNCENPPGKKVACDDFNAAKVKSTKTLPKGNHDQGSELKNSGFAGFQAGSLGATVKGLESVLDVELSPSRALRVAKMKNRFAGLIVKAQHHKLLEPGGGIDAAAWQHEKEMLQTRQHEEKAKIEAEISAARSAARLRIESERQKQRQAEREAARIALQKVEQSVFVDNNLEVLKDLEALIGSSLLVMCHDRRSHPKNMCSQMMNDKLKSPLERLGLYIKEEYRVGDESDYVFTEDEELEEGEVI